MTPAALKEAHRAWLIAALEDGDDRVFGSTMSHGHTFNLPLSYALSPGPRGAIEALRALRTSFEEWTVRVLDQVASGERVLSRFEATALHVGSCGPVPPTGAQWTFRGLLSSRFVGALALETALECNVFEELLRREALVPRPEVELVPRPAPIHDDEQGNDDAASRTA